MNNIFETLKLAITGNDEAVLSLLKNGGHVESFGESSNGLYVDTIVFTNSKGKRYSYSKFSDGSTPEKVTDGDNKNLGTVSLKCGAKFYANTYGGALKCLKILKDKYETALEDFVKIEEYTKADNCRNAIEEIDEKIGFYERKKGHDPEDGSVQMGAI